MRTIELVIGFGGRELNPLEALDDPGDGLPLADAHRCDAVTRVAPFQLCEQRRRDARTGRPQGWPSDIPPPFGFTSPARQRSSRPVSARNCSATRRRPR